MTSTPGRIDPYQNPEPWRPGKDAVGGPPPGEILDGPHVIKNMPEYLHIEGYDGVSFKKQKQIQPVSTSAHRTETSREMSFTDVAKIDEKSCRDSMLQYVSEQCCYGKKAAQNMTILRFDGITALHYILESFTESRHIQLCTEPYRGGPVDGPENGPPPTVWCIPCDPNQVFDPHIKVLEVPHTSVIQHCEHCVSRGWLWCWKCGGFGYLSCLKCDGKGKIKTMDVGSKTMKQVTCSKCKGRGKVSCTTCNGVGRVICNCCDGYSMVRCFIQVFVKFTNHIDDYFLESTDMPDDLVKAVEGEVVFEDIQSAVLPLTSFPVQEINEQSKKMIESHKNNWSSERIHKQRQTLRGVPVTEVRYEWKNKERRFWVYGNERKVYAPDYPDTCCCGCSIL
ncbi:Protein ssuh2 [Mactra antiquata]